METFYLLSTDPPVEMLLLAELASLSGVTVMI